MIILIPPWRKKIIISQLSGKNNCRQAGIIIVADHVFKDNNERFAWFKKTAEQGLVEAQYMLGAIYRDGVFKDLKESFKWYRKAAKQGHVYSQMQLGLMYSLGRGGSQDFKESVEWYRKAAEQGLDDALFCLGLLYSRGQGVLQNEVIAYAFFSLAAVNGDVNATKMRDQVAGELSKQEIKQGRKIAADLQKKIHQNQLSESTASSPKTTTTKPKISGSGSGFLITNNGYLITCYHVIDGASKVTISTNNKEYPAKLVRADKLNDIALLKIDGTFPALSFASRNSVKMGSDVFTIGYPNPIMQGVNQKLTEGTINALTGYQDDIRLYQISVPVQSGNSGGSLLNEHGDVVGIIVAMLKAETAFKVTGNLPQNVNYALKSTYAQALIDTVPEAIDSLQKPHRKKSNDVVERVKKSVVMVLAYK